MLGYFETGLCGAAEKLPYRVTFRKKTRKLPSELRVALSLPYQMDFTVKRESWFDRLGKALGICGETQTGDSHFDSSYFLTGNDQEPLTILLRSAEARAAISNVLGQGFTAIEHKAGDLSAVWTKFSGGGEDEIGPRAAMELKKIAEGAINSGAASLPYRPSYNTTKRNFLYGVSGALMALGLIGLPYVKAFCEPLDVGGIFRFSFQYSGPALIAAILIAASLIRGRSTAHRELAVVILLACISFPICGYSLASHLNAAWDKSAEERRELPVIDKYVSTGKHSTYYVVTPGVIPGHTKEKFPADPATYRNILPGRSKVNLVTRSGAFGFVWIARLTFSTPP